LLLPIPQEPSFFRIQHLNVYFSFHEKNRLSDRRFSHNTLNFNSTYPF
jgi:hypothetical protein